MRQYVRQRKLELAQKQRETFVPQSYAWGVEAQVDWYEAYADEAGERQKLQVFTMRSMTSGAVFHPAYRRATQQAFLEAHELALEHFGGLFQRLRYDNLSSAVKRVLRRVRRTLAFLPARRQVAGHGRIKQVGEPKTCLGKLIGYFEGIDRRGSAPDSGTSVDGFAGNGANGCHGCTASGWNVRQFCDRTCQPTRRTRDPAGLQALAPHAPISAR